MGYAHALELQLSDRQEAVVGRIAEVDHLRVRVPGLSVRVPPLDRHPAPDEAVELPVVLEERAGEVDPRELLDRLLQRRFRQVAVEAGQRRTQVTNQHNLTFVRAAQGSVWPEGLRVVGVNALPSEHLLQMVGKGLLDQPVFAIDVGDQMGFPYFQPAFFCRFVRSTIFPFSNT